MAKPCDCSNNGFCTNQGICHCSPGFTGENCSEICFDYYGECLLECSEDSIFDEINKICYDIPDESSSEYEEEEEEEEISLNEEG